MNDWTIARICLQVIAEQGPGMAYAEAEARDTALFKKSLEALGA